MSLSKRNLFDMEFNLQQSIVETFQLFHTDIQIKNEYAEKEKFYLIST